MSGDKIFRGFREFMETIHSVDESDYPSIVEFIHNGAEIRGLTMVQWMILAITQQYVRDSFHKWEREGLVMRTGEYRDDEPVFIELSGFYSEGLN